VRRYLLALSLGLFAVIGCCVWAPWMQVDSSGGSTSLGFAPVWTSDFRYFPGAMIDTRALATHVMLAVIFVALIGMGQAMRRQG